MTVIKLEIHVLYQKLYGAEHIEHKEVSVENALQVYRPMANIIRGYTRMFPSISAPVYYIPKFVDLENNRQLELKQCKRKSLSSLVDQNRDYCSFDNKITMMMYLFSLAPSTPITLSEFDNKKSFDNKITLMMYLFSHAPSTPISVSEFSMEFYVKVHIYNPYDRLLTVAVKKHFFTDSNFQTPFHSAPLNKHSLLEIMNLFTRLTVDELGDKIDENEDENVFYHLISKKGVKNFTSNVPVQKFVQRHRKSSPHQNRIIILIHAFYIEKVDQHSSDESSASSS